MKGTWENIERLLRESPTSSDVEIAFRLSCRRGEVSRVRRDLGMAPRPLPVMDLKLTPETRVMLGAVLTSGGHRRWVGRRTSEGVPLLDHRTTVARVAFRMHYGREPEGRVRVGCLMKHCVEGSHLVDQVMRRNGTSIEAGVAW